jgi:hypothetical protein
VDELGRVLGVREFANDPHGHLALLAWTQDQPAPRAIGVEGSGNYGAALCRTLASAGEQVHEVPATLTFRERRRKGSQGKSDPVDAVAIARVVARGEILPRHGGPRRSPTSSSCPTTVTSFFVPAPSSPTACTETWWSFIRATSSWCRTSWEPNICPGRNRWSKETRQCAQTSCVNASVSFAE